MHLTRRRFLSSLGATAALPLTGTGWVDRLLAAQDASVLQPPPGGRLLRVVPLGRFDGRPAPPLGQVLGTGLDARRFADISGLTPETLVTPTDQFFVRTAASTAHSGRSSARIRVLGSQPIILPADLAALAQPMGTHLLECSGNSDPANFGLISAADWSGVPIGALLDRARPPAGSSFVRVSGFDDTRQRSQTSVAGAVWIFPRADLERAGAFLATGMNGGPLPLDHGFPARLVVPGWYGCVCIKWVTAVDLVGPDERPSEHMREFAERTHQVGPGGEVPTRARDFQPATIDLAAMPVRVEQWQVGDARVYRVVGVRWGGEVPAQALTIRFRHDERYVRVEHSPAPASTTTWSLWSHTWRPDSPGRYQITLGVADATIRTRRLDLFYYVREIEVDEV